LRAAADGITIVAVESSIAGEADVESFQTGQDVCNATPRWSGRRFRGSTKCVVLTAPTDAAALRNNEL